MIYRFICLLFILISINNYAQQNKEDVFPLQINNNWIYTYQSLVATSDNMGNGFSEKDSGLVIYNVIDSSKIADSIKWNIQTIQNIRIHYSEDSLFIQTVDTIFNGIDTAYFNLWEKVDGNHHIFVNNPYYYGNPIWKFMYSYPDSQQIHRFQFMDSFNRVSIKTNSAFGFYGGIQIPVQMVFAKDTGLISLSAQAYSILNEHSVINISYNLLSNNVTAIGSKRNPDAISPNFDLSQNYPNPFNPTTNIRYSLKKSGLVTLKVYNLLGQEVETLVNMQQSRGNHYVIFDASKLSSGVYFYSLRQDDNFITKRMILVK